MNIPTIIYAAKSTDDLHGSIPTQISDCEAMADREGWAVEGTYSDEAASAYKGNRGQELADARAHAERLAAEHGSAQIIVQHSDRLARGDGVAADHLLEVALWAMKCSVRIRSVQDDGTFENLVMTAIMGERNHEDSKRKSAAVKAGKRRAAEQGRWNGGPPPAGYDLRSKARNGRVESWLVKHPKNAPIYELLWRLAEAGHSIEAISLELNRRGFRTTPTRKDAAPRTFEPSTVQNVLNNPRYAGIVVYQGERLEGVTAQWPAFVDRETFDRLKAERAQRSHLTKRKPGRPAAPFVLQGLATCGLCGSPMHSIGKFDRRTSKSARRYECRAHRDHSPKDASWCAAKPIRADRMDAMVVEGLPALLADATVLRDRLLADRKADRERLKGVAQQAAAEVTRLEAEKAANDRRYRKSLSEAVDDDRLALFTDASAALRGELVTAVERRERALEAITDGDEQSEADDPQVALAKLAERLIARFDDVADDVRAINLLLREWFQTFGLLSDGSFIAAVPLLDAAAAAAIDLKTWPYGFNFEISATALKAVIDDWRPDQPGTLDPDSILAHGGTISAPSGPPPLESDAPNAPIRGAKNPRTPQPMLCR